MAGAGFAVEVGGGDAVGGADPVVGEEEELTAVEDGLAGGVGVKEGGGAADVEAAGGGGEFAHFPVDDPGGAVFDEEEAAVGRPAAGMAAEEAADGFAEVGGRHVSPGGV